ncbi:MAG: single-stranded DNA-binding protein [Patescibacteria group bacterium]|nr:single-stranded DNA-binding protein [Patescibacteria group bacterium]
MAARSLNKAMVIGNLTRDPELRYTPQGTAVCTFGVASNRSWTTDTGEKKEETEFHRVVAWTKLAELCSQLLFKGRRVYVEGRLQTRQWNDKENNQRQTTEIVITDMIILDNKRADDANLSSSAPTPDVSEEMPVVDISKEAEEAPIKDKALVKKTAAKADDKKAKPEGEEITSEDVSKDIPF